jgi:hypothetical protein
VDPKALAEAEGILVVRRRFEDGELKMQPAPDSKPRPPSANCRASTLTLACRTNGFLCRWLIWSQKQLFDTIQRISRQ